MCLYIGPIQGLRTIPLPCSSLQTSRAGAKLRMFLKASQIGPVYNQDWKLQCYNRASWLTGRGRQRVLASFQKERDKKSKENWSTKASKTLLNEDALGCWSGASCTHLSANVDAHYSDCQEDTVVTEMGLLTSRDKGAGTPGKTTAYL